MPRIIMKILENYEEFIRFLQKQPQVESHLQAGSFFMINFVSKEEQDFALFQKEAKDRFSVLGARELCHGKCRDNTDCLNTAKMSKYCWKHAGD